MTIMAVSLSAKSPLGFANQAQRVVSLDHHWTMHAASTGSGFPLKAKAQGLRFTMETLPLSRLPTASPAIQKQQINTCTQPTMHISTTNPQHLQQSHPHSLPHFLPHSLPHCSQLQHHFQDCLQHHLPSRSSKSIHVRNLLCTFLQLTMPYQKYMHVVCYFDPTHLLHLKKCLTCRKFSQNLMIGMSIYEIHPKRKN